MEEPAREPENARSGVEDIIDAVADLLQTAVDWLRQEASSLVQEKVVQPVQRVGLTLVSAFAAALLMAVALTFIAVAAFLYLASSLGYPGALLVVGLVLLIAAGVFLVIKARSMQK